MPTCSGKIADMVAQPRDLREAPLDELESVARDALARRFRQIVEAAGDDTPYFVGLARYGATLFDQSGVERPVTVSRLVLVTRLGLQFN